MKPRRRILFVPDTHCPYHDRRAWDAMMNWAAPKKPTDIVVLGDLADFYAVSFHAKDPKRRHSLAWELGETRKLVKELERLGSLNLVYCMGNHENRLSRYIADRAPELDGLISLEKELGLEGKWKVVPYMDDHRIGKLWVTHEAGFAGSTAIPRTQAKYESNVVFGHTHRAHMEYSRNVHGEPRVAATFGWLGSFKDVNYTYRVSKHSWTHGFGWGSMDDRGNVYLSHIPIVRGRAIS